MKEIKVPDVVTNISPDGFFIEQQTVGEQPHDAFFTQPPPPKKESIADIMAQ